MNKNQRGEFFVTLVEQVSRLPVAVVIGSVIQIYRNNVPLKPSELETACGNLKALCPFHPDEKLGSFVVTQLPDKNMWYCFTDAFKWCNWSVIDFEERYFNFWQPEWDDSAKDEFAQEKTKAFKQAVFHLARRFDLITEDEYNRYASKKIDAAVVHHVQRKLEEKKKKMVESQKADQDVIDTVYYCMARVCKLSPAHEKHLKKERRLKESELADYFTFPTRRVELAKHIYREAALLIAKKNFEKPDREIKTLKDLSVEELEWLKATPGLAKLEKQMPYVPGFFYDESRKRIDFSSYTGIGFLVKDDLGHVNGIQVRRDKVKEGETRYVWFSSAFAQTKDDCCGGISCGSPGGIIFSKRKDKPAELCITEGRFKAEMIAKEGNDAVYISGVSTWKSVLSMVDRVKGERRKVFIMFDSDMMGNVAVHTQLSDIAKEMYKHELFPILVVWPIARGKGFDDLVIGSGCTYYKKLKYVPYVTFEPIYQNILAETLSSFGVKHPRELKQEDRAMFNQNMQKFVEQAILKNEEETKK